MGYWIKTIKGKQFRAKAGVSWTAKSKAKKYAMTQKAKGYLARVIKHRGRWRVFINCAGK